MTTRRYAEKTTVTTEASRTEIERTLVRYGAKSFVYGWDDTHGTAVIQFAIKDALIKFRLPTPARAEFEKTASGKPRTEIQVDQELAQARKQRWRALALIIKAKLEAIESGIVTLEEEFLANLLLPDGSIVGDHARQQLPEMRRQAAAMEPIEILPAQRLSIGRR